MSLSIGITCYPTFGGSGIVATETGLEMARRGHRVHFICTDVPGRLDRYADNVFFHQVRARDYPVFPQVPYSLALTSAMVSVARWEGLDLLHAHYAVPHATSAWMAREVLGGGGPRLVTTLHGTDITLVGADESYLPITRHSILQSDAVTAPSRFLVEVTRRRFDLAELDIDVVPNFVDTATYRPREGEARPRMEALFGPEAAHVPVIVHVSNFRPVKRLDRVVEAFTRLASRRPAFLLLIGDGPERPRVERMVREGGLRDRVRLVGNQEHVAPMLAEGSAFLLPSETESFGLAVLEALACGVPVVASAVGGLPEVVHHGETGFLVAPDDVDGMADRLQQLLDDRSLHGTLATAARRDVLVRFDRDALVDRYEAIYHRVVTRG